MNNVITLTCSRCKINTFKTYDAKDFLHKRPINSWCAECVHQRNIARPPQPTWLKELINKDILDKDDIDKIDEYERFVRNYLDEI